MEYKGVSNLRKEALNVLVKMLNEKEISHLRVVFEQVDKDRTGMISIQELEDAIKSHSEELSGHDIKHLFTQVDYKGNGKINYSEFLAATISVKSVLTDEKLYALFKHFDTDGSDYITPQNLKEAFAVGGKDLTDEEVAQILAEHDIKKDNRLNFDEFKAIFFDEDHDLQIKDENL